jgi:hypothetical protein
LPDVAPSHFGSFAVNGPLFMFLSDISMAASSQVPSLSSV